MSELKEEAKFYQLMHPGGPAGIVTGKPEMRAQDAEAVAGEFYAVVFFPRITSLGPARITAYDAFSTLAQSPEAAKAKFLDRIKQGEEWETYVDAGWRIRKVRLSDLGEATPLNDSLPAQE